VLQAASAHAHPTPSAHVTVDSRRGPVSMPLAEVRRRVAQGAVMCLFDLILCLAGCMLTVVATAVTLASG
jgi:hypothetical protein